ncbi:MAG: hypothetical protein JJU13_03230 [Balneolaceae bacterium]|nr:hypothetical protein [Balneolaceae bacterium]
MKFMITRSTIYPFALLLIFLSACGEAEPPETQYDHTPEEAGMTQELSPEQIAFWDNIQQHCGNAYEGVLADATPFYHSFDVDRIVIHVRNCTDTLTHISLHLDDNHSRNLLLTKADGTLRLKHDHRNEDGTEEEITQYGGDAPKPGLETRQIFEADAHTAEILPDRFDNFWFMDLMDEETFGYGVHWPKHGNSIRMEFDISNPVEAPPTPWGY